MHNNWPYCPDVIAFIAFLLIAKSIPWSLLPIWLSHSLIVPLLNYVTDGSLCYCNFLFFFSLFPVSLLFKIHYSPLQALPSPSLFSFFFFLSVSISGSCFVFPSSPSSMSPKLCGEPLIFLSWEARRFFKWLRMYLVITPPLFEF